MDDKWFKQRQKIAGVTAEDIAQEMGRDRSVVSRIYVGRQKMSVDQAKIFARVLDVPLSDVLQRAGILDEGEERRAVPGLAEGDASPFVPKGTGRSGEQAIATALGGGKPGIDIWVVGSDAMALGGYLQGDFILVNTHKSELCKAGDVVIAQKYDWQTGGATTLLRRFEPPVLVAASTNPDVQRAIVVDGDNVVIMGKVIASWRA